MRTNGNLSWLVKAVHPTGKETVKAMGERVVDMQFSLPVYVDFMLNDFIVLDNETYKINLTPTVEKKAKRLYDYTIQFEHEFYDLAKIQIQGLNPQNGYLEPSFSVTGNASTIITLIVENINRAYPGWTVGVIDETEYKNFTFSAQNCLQALNQLASDYKTEFWIENKTIHLQKREQSSGLTFAYGQGKGLYNILRQNKTSTNIITRLYVRGSSENLPIGYRDYAGNLLLPGGLTYIQDDAKVDLYGLIEGTQNFEIKPEREGTITSVVSGDGNWKYFTDTSMDFNLNDYKLSDAAKITFNTGQLAGYTFTLSSYNNSTKTFTINKNDEEKSIEVPSNLLRPAVGDKYVILNIQMPPLYVTDGENRLLNAGQTYYDQNSDPKFLLAYSAKCDRLFIKQNQIEVQLGNTAIINDPDMGLNTEVRIASYSRDLQDRNLYDEVEWADTIGPNEIVRQYAQQQRTLKLIESSGLLTPDQLRKNIFLNRLSELNGYLMLAGNKVKAGMADFATDAARAALADYATDSDKWDEKQFADFLDQPVRKTDPVKFASVEADTLNSKVYVSGFTGVGYKINPDGSAEFDSITIRKDLNVNVLNIREITGTGGSLAITNVAKIKDVIDAGTYYQCTINTDDNTIAVQFRNNDIIRCQVWDGKRLKFYSARIVNAQSGFFEFYKSEIIGGGVPSPGDTVFQFGNTTDVNRQGLIYMTNSDSGAPYLDVLDGINSVDLTGKTKVRLGKLNGINDPDFGALQGYGLYGENVYLKNGKFKGEIIVTGGNAETIAGAQSKADAAQIASAGYTDNKSLQALSAAQIYADASAQSKANVAQANAISQASTDAQAKAEAAKNAANLLTQQLIDGLKVGGRNYVLNSDVYFTQNVANGGNFFYSFENDLQSLRGKTVITSFYLEVNNAVGGRAMYEPAIRFTDGSYLSFPAIRILAANESFKGIVYGTPIVVPDKPIAGIIQRGIWIECGGGLNVGRPKFEFGNKATDWTPAPEDVQAAIDNAKALADQAKAAYTALTGSLKSLAFEDVVQKAKLGDTIIERGMLKNDLIDTQYLRANVANIEYLQGLEYNFTQGTLDRLKANIINAAQIISDGGGATLNFVNTQITAATNQSAADATVKASAAQVAAIQVAAADAANQIAGVQLGGRNLALSSKGIVQAGNDFGNSNNSVAGQITVLNSDTWNSYAFFDVAEKPFALGQQLCYSIDVMCTASAQVLFNFMPHFSANNFVSTVNLSAGKWIRVSVAGIISNNENDAFLCGFSGSNMTGAVLNYKNLKVEKGNKSTDWSPAPEDISADAQAKADAAQTAATNAAYAQAALEREVAKAYADGKITAEELARIAQAQTNLQAAKDDAQAKVTAALGAANGYTDTKSQQTLSAAQTYADASAQSKANVAQANAISQASTDAQAKADAAKIAANLLSQQLIDGLKVGGRNYALNTNVFFTQNIANGGNFSYSFENDLQGIRGKTVITSFYLEVNNAAGGRVMYEPAIQFTDNTTLGFKAIMILAANESFKGIVYGAPVTIPDKPIAGIIQRGIWIECGGGLNVGRPKFEFGNKATDWIPAPEDVQAAIDNAKALADQANAAYTALTANLKSLAYADVVEVAKLGTSVMQGGMLKNNLIDTDYLKVNVVNAAYIESLNIVAKNIEATTGTIGGWSLASDRIFSGSESANYIALKSGTSPELYMKNSSQVTGEYSSINTKGLFILSTGNALPTPYGSYNAVGAFKLKETSTSNSVALYVSAKTGQNLAFYCDGDFFFSTVGTFKDLVVFDGKVTVNTGNFTISNIPQAMTLGGGNAVLRIITNGVNAGRLCI